MGYLFNNKRMAFPHEGKKFKKGLSGNLNGRPKGTFTKKHKLKKLIKDISEIINTLTDREKLIAYQLYEIAENDININNVSSSVLHLYFIESEFGIKIGRSKNVENRLKQIKLYAESSKIIKTINFAGNFESDIHNKFKDINIKNNQTIGIEWFNKSVDLLDFIDDLDCVNDLHKYFNPKGIGQTLLF